MAGTAQATVDWPRFHDDLANTGYNPSETFLAPSNAGLMAPVWTYATGQTSSNAAPRIVVVGGVAYLGTGHGVFALRATTGVRLWQHAAAGETGTPAVANGLVYVSTAGGDIYALDATTGHLVWTFATGAYAASSSPSVVGDVVYVGSQDGNVYALDASSGAQLWRYATGGSVDSSPAVVNGSVYVNSSDRNVYALDASTGALDWSYTSTTWFDTSPAVAGGLVYVANTGGLRALDATTGQQVWSLTQGLAFSTSPTVANGTIYVGAGFSIYAVDAASGGVRWHYTTGTSAQAGAGVANGVVYAGGGDGSMHALDASTGQLLWQSAGYGAGSDPAIVNGTLYFGAYDGTAYAFSAPGTTTLAVTVQGKDAGHVTSSPAGIDCPPTCSAAMQYTPGVTKVTLTETPAAGGAPFAGWQSSDCSGTITTCTVTLEPVELAVTAGFGTPPGAPTSVNATPGTGELDMSWTPPASDGGLPITDYRMTVRDLDLGSTTSFDAGAGTAGVATGLRTPCQIDRYQVSVTATNLAGQGPASAPTPSVRPLPTYVAILMQGMNTKTGSPQFQQWDPLSVDYCNLKYGSAPADVKSITDSYDPEDSLPTSFTDRIALVPGTVILPFSYNGAKAVAAPGAPDGYVFQEEPYSAVDTWTHPPPVAAPQLATEVDSVHLAWPGARIVIVGHSEGGFVAETYFRTMFDPAFPEGVVHIFSLDSPINGLLSPAAVVGPLCVVQGFDCLTGSTFPYWTAAWANQLSWDQEVLAKDQASQGPSPVYIPVGTIGDLLYIDGNLMNTVGCAGVNSQLLYDTNDCGYHEPIMVGPDVISPQNAGPPLIQPGYPAAPPCCSVASLFGSHQFVFESSYVMCLVVYLSMNAPPCSGVAGAGLLRPDRSPRPASPLAYVPPPPPTGSLAQNALSVGQAVAITGSRFGSTSGSVVFAGAQGGQVEAAITTWSDTSIGVTVPSGAVTGPVFVVTPDGLGTPVGDATVLGPPGAVSSLQPHVPAGPNVNGQPATVTIRALDGSGHAAPNATVTVSDGTSLKDAITDSSGVATFTLKGYWGPTTFIAYSGATHTAFQVTWTPPPPMSISVSASQTTTPAGSPVTIEATVADSNGAPVADQPVLFDVGGPSGVQLSGATATTDGSGVATVTASSAAPASGVVSADADYGTAVGVVQVTWTTSVTGVSPRRGTAAGGTSVTITGSGFVAGATVSFGSRAATNVTVTNASTITAVAPKGAGTVDVIVTEPGGASVAVRADRFTFVPRPSVIGIQPSSGPASGGTRVTIMGTGFLKGARVLFGSTRATDVVVVSGTKITATSPAGVGVVDVRVKTVGGTSRLAPADRFTYI